jgi:hypothetical protein
MRRTLFVPLVAALLLSGCGGDGPTEPAGTPGLHVVAGAGVTDTVDAILPAELVVELRDQNAKPRAGVAVVFFVSEFNFSGAMVARSGTLDFQLEVVDTTDASGRATARVRLGRLAAQKSVSVAVVGEPQTRTEANYTVVPGAAAIIRTSPRDTAIYATRSYPLSVVVTDRHGNSRPDAVQFAALTPTLARVSGTGVVEALAVGRARVQVSSGGLAETVSVSIPPQGVFTATRIAGSGSSFRIRVVSMQLDGTGETIDISTDFWSDAGFAWSPDGGTLAVAIGDHDADLYRKSTAGVARLVQSPTTLWSKAFPRYSHDGAWVYFNGRTGGTRTEIWRARADGTGAERVGPPAGDYDKDVGPDPSPDGTRVAYSTNRANVTMPVIRILTLATRTVSAIDAPGVTPRWTPDGTRVAFVSTGPQWGYLSDSRAMGSAGSLVLMDPAGANRTTLDTGSKRWSPHFDFSPDGKYILALSNAGLVELVEVATGTTIPLPFARGLILPEWKP